MVSFRQECATGDDGQGFWLAQKRMSAGRFRYWPTATDAVSRRLAAHEFTALIWGGHPQRAQAAPMWHRLGFDAPGREAPRV